MREQYQTRDEPSVYPIIDIISAAFGELSDSDLSRAERKLLSKSWTWINKLLELERYRKQEVDRLALSAFSGNEVTQMSILKRIARLDKKISKLEPGIMAMESEPGMQRIMSAGEECLKKNPHLIEQHERAKERNHQNYQILLFKGL